MSECPNCGKEIKVPNRAFFNADQYNRSANTISYCCNTIIRIIPVRSYRIEKTDLAQDDWGVESHANKERQQEA